MQLRYISLLLVLPIVLLIACEENYLNILPEDALVSETFWKTEDDVVLALSGIYNVLRDPYMYGEQLRFSAWSPDAYQWNGANQVVGNGQLTTGHSVPTNTWTSAYKILSRANFFLENIEQMKDLDTQKKAAYIAEARFLRGIGFSILAEHFGGVPIVTSVIGVEEARQLTRASEEETWAQAISDFEAAAEGLEVEAPLPGRATVGAALGMKMRAYLYQNKYPDVLTVTEQIEDLNVYDLFPSYEGLFQIENENNQEVLFDLQHIGGPQGQGPGQGITFQRPGTGTPTAGHAAPTPDLINTFEMADGSEIDPDNPYEGRDPRLGFSVVLPGTYFGNYLFPVDAQVHVGQPLKDYAMRKYTETLLIGGEFPAGDEPEINFIILRYADVLLARAEALIETNQDLDEAIGIINRIRTERDDVTITALPTGLSQEEAREALRRERRVEFAFEGRIHWSDIRRWEIGPDIYPQEIRGTDGGLVETRYAQGYQLPKDKYFPIPDNEISLNPNLTQNEGW